MMGNLKISGLRNKDSFTEEQQIDANMYGHNIGNNLFYMAVYRSVDWNECIEAKRSDADVYVLPCANFFSKYAIAHLNKMAESLKEQPIKTVVVGIGVTQQREFTDTLLQQASVNFIEAVLETGGYRG